jgi:hypothetical protein
LLLLLVTTNGTISTISNSIEQQHRHHSHHHRKDLIHKKACTNNDIFVGNWSYHEKIVVRDNPYRICPKTVSMISDNFFLGDHVYKYSCVNSTYTHATFHPSICQWLPLHELFTKLKGQKISFVGDSLIIQLYLATLCNLESLGFPTNHMELEVHPNMLLRPDLPCDRACIDPNYIDPNGFPVFCFACPNGVFMPFNESFMTYDHYWAKYITSNTTAIIIGAGAWYNAWKKVNNPIESYHETIDKLAPVFRKFIQEKNISVFWIDLPPMTPDEKVGYEKYNWNVFDHYGQYARERLTPEGVIFVESNLATGPRRMIDGNIAILLLWCSPGISTIPIFIDHAIFQMIVTSQEQQEEQTRRAQSVAASHEN